MSVIIDVAVHCEYEDKAMVFPPEDKP